MVAPNSSHGETLKKMSTMTTRKKSSLLNPPILSEKYLDGAKSKNDLVQRLQNVIEALSDESVDPSYPGLDGLALRLAAVNEKKNESLLRHKDKEVRLYTVMACLEIFAIYAPEPPFDPEEVFEIFSQLIAQLGNLSHTTLDTQPNYHNYFSILEHLSQVRTGIVLVEYCQGYSGAIAPSHGDHEDDDQQMAKRALELLTDLIQIILESIQIEHSSEVRHHAVTAIAACIGEFQLAIPTCVLDVLLSCISRGPKVWVHPAVRQLVNGDIVAASSKSSKRNIATQSNMAAPQLEKVDNVSYKIAAKVIEITKEKCSTSIATLLNGILNGDSFAVSHSSISAEDFNIDILSSSAKKSQPTQEDTSHAVPNVWSIVYEMHRIAPDILTTVIGTIASNLRSEENTMRLRVVRLLGRLFYSPKSLIAVRFITCYREWCHRYKDLEVEIRLTVLTCIIQTMDTYATEEASDSKELRQISISTLESMVQFDPDSGIREAAIQQICELCLTRPEIIPPSLLHAVSDRIKGKNTTKAERMLALTGLAQLYHIHYLQKKLLPVEQCDTGSKGAFDNLSCVNEVLSTTRGKSPKSKRTPKVMQKDDELFYRSPAQVEEQFYWIPEIVMESAWYTDQIDSEMRSRVIQIIDDVLLGPASEVKEETNESSRIMKFSPTGRALGLTLMLNSFAVSDEHLNVEETNAYKWLSSLLTQRASLQAALSAYLNAKGNIKNYARDSVEALKANATAISALEKVIAFTPTSMAEKEKLVKSLHGARDRHLFRVLGTIATPAHSKASRSRALQDLPQRAKQCSFTKTEIAWLKVFARRCAMGSIDTELTEHLILLIKLCVQSLVAGSFEAKLDLYNAGCMMKALKLVSKVFPKLAVTRLSHLQEIFLTLRTNRKESRRSAASSKDFETIAIPLIVSILEVIALAIPCADVQALDPRFEKELVRICTSGQCIDLIKLSIHILSSTAGRDMYGELLKVCSDIYTLSLEDLRLSAALTGLSVLCECFSDQWRESFKMGKIDDIVNYSFHQILLLQGRHQSPVVRCTPNSNSSGSTRRAPRNKESATNTTSSICASIALLCSHIRSIHGMDSKDTVTFCDEEKVILSLQKIVQNQGTLDTWSKEPCQTSLIRQTAAVSLFRMIGDVTLKLEDRYHSIELWHCIANSLLDGESDMRSCLVKEWMQSVSGSSIYCHGKKFAPSLRFLAMGIYCVDGENLYPMANGFASNVSSLCTAAKETVLQCIVALRRTCHIVEAQCAALGAQGVANFEKRLKMKIMPEFALPFAFHLLSHRSETPTMYSTSDADEDVKGGMKSFSREETEPLKDEDDDFSSKEYMKARLRQLKKRLFWLLEPLVVSLGDSGDNISFLLRMSELIGKKFRPVLASEKYNSSDTSKRLEVVCRAARDVLLKFVKKDADLSNYSGPIQIPTTLFIKRSNIATNDDKSSHRRERGFVSFADEVDSKIGVERREHSQSNDIAEPSEHTSHSKELQHESASAKWNKNTLPGAPTLLENEQPSNSEENLDGSSLDKASNSKEASTVNVETPSQDGNWDMSPIAPSASPHNADFTLSSSAGETSFISCNVEIHSTGAAESPVEAVAPTTPHSQPSSLTPILRTGVLMQSSSSSKKLNVTFSSKDASLDGGQTFGKFLSNTPLSEISNESGLIKQAQKRQRTAPKKIVVMKAAPASSASSRVTASSKSSRSSRRTRSSASKSPSEIEENDLDFNDFDDSENVDPPLKRKASNKANVKHDEAFPVKRTKTAKKSDKPPKGAGTTGSRNVKKRPSSSEKSVSTSRNAKKKIRATKQL